MNPRPRRAGAGLLARTPERRNVPPFRRAVLLVLAGAAVFLAALLGGAAPASAHANLLFTGPAADSTVPAGPQSLTLLFDEPVSPGAAPVTVTGPRGRLALGSPVASNGNRALEVPVRGTAAPGIYTVTWQASAQDGDVMGGSYRYAVGPATTALGGGQATSTKGSWPTGILRGLLFTALALALGESLGPMLLRRIPAALALPRRWAAWAAGAGLLASAALAVLLLGGGSLAAGITHPSTGVLFSTRPGILALAETGGFGLAAAGVLLRRRGWAWVPLAAVIVAEALRAHPQLANPAIGIPLTMVHLGAAALWAGTLLYVLRAAFAWRARREMARAAISAYAGVALWLFVAVVFTGFASALLLVPLADVTSTDYGRALLAKMGLVAVAAGLAVTARGRLRRGSPQKRLTGPARAETVALAGVLGVSALLTVLPLPADANAPLAFPPPAAGPVVPAAALAGQIGVNARASAGQLVINLTVPEIDDPSGQAKTPAFTLAGAIGEPDSRTQKLNFRGCGTGCFVSPVTWKDGANALTLSPGADGWAGQAAGLTVAWPPDPDPALLAATVNTMKAVPSFTLHERVTSDPARGLGTPQAFPMSGKDFIQRALYASGTATITTRLPDEDGHRRLVLSYPSENVVLNLTLSQDGRILNETQTAPHHLVTRTFTYPEPAEPR
ncbi:copper resistance CopC/CopD family protein [Arthrobacter sp. A2-55]|uniref:copper resistance CopC/CopD family protein n=1 Tax=Arthrobacter sp. A2-55 TaxID=2897337 RepID=UPI0021CD202D|nr:copper resistance protein CopC/CopD [Arthrobacter sp. A2-55]MCU6481798.1 copper resistance protein CopC/CopD [Arthrobacter sp. A2-55]